MDEMKLSVIGTGRWGSTLIKKFMDITDIHMVYGHQNIDQLHEYTLSNGYPHLKYTEDIDKLIHESDIVVVVSPPRTHYELAKRVLTAGKHLWLEKPGVLKVQDAIDLQTLADNYGCIAMVDHILCYAAEARLFQTVLSKWKDGEFKHLVGSFSKSGVTKTDIDDNWNLSVHLIALAVYWSIPWNQCDFVPSFMKPDHRLISIHSDNGVKLRWDILKNRHDILKRLCDHFLYCVQKRISMATDMKHLVKVTNMMEKLYGKES